MTKSEATALAENVRDVIARYCRDNPNLQASPHDPSDMDRCLKLLHHAPLGVRTNDGPGNDKARMTK